MCLCQLIPEPAETTFTTFFPRYYITDEKELASYFELEVDGPVTQSPNVKAFFRKCQALGVDVQIGYGEDTGRGRYNTAVYVSGKTGEVLSKYRKVSKSSVILIVRLSRQASVSVGILC